MRITQSISLSNIHAFRFIGKARPWGRGNLPYMTACSRIGVAHGGGGDQETVNESGGADRDRTDDPLLAKQVLSQLSYSPTMGACGRDGGPG